MPYLPAVRRGTCGRHQQPVGEGDFTHPRVGQAEHLACRKRLPNACLRAEARTHFPLTASYTLLPHLKACATENNIRAEWDFCN